MKFKFPILVGSVFILLSLPFIFGLLQPSTHEGRYPALYVILNMPALMIVSRVAQKIGTVLITDCGLYTANLITMALVFLFWLAISFTMGAFFDTMSKKRKSE